MTFPVSLLLMHRTKKYLNLTLLLKIFTILKTFVDYKAPFNTVADVVLLGTSFACLLSKVYKQTADLRKERIQ